MDLILEALVTLGAAFAGAFFAFQFEKSQRDNERVDNEVAAGNRALFTLTQIWSKLRQYQKEVIGDYRARPDAWLNLPVSAPIQDNSLTFDMKDLNFVLRARPATFQLLFLEADRFQLAAQIIEQRGNLVLSEVFRKLSAAGIGIGDNRPADEIETILGAGTVQQLRVLTTGIIKNVDEDVASSREAFVKLRTVLKEIYPKQKFIDLTPEA